MDLYRETLDIFRERKFIKGDLILPTYICSIGAHMFNFTNKHKQLYWSGGDVPDMRLHIFMVTLPGFGKTYTINQFVGKHGGILTGSEIHTGKVASLTSSGLVGSIKSTQDGQTVVTKGVLQKKSDFILGCDEFSNIVTSSKTSHSGNLINDLLTAFDTGEMNKDQSGGGIEYDTFATMWAATQPGRFELSAGLPRRFAFVIFMPSVADVYAFRKNRQEAQNINVDKDRVAAYKLAIKKRFIEIKENLKTVSFSKEYYKWVNTYFATHYEDMLTERIVLGYWMMKLESIPEHVELTLNDEVKAIVVQQREARLTVSRGVDRIRIGEVLKSIKEITVANLTQLLMTFGMPEKYISDGLLALSGSGAIKIENGMVVNLKFMEVK